MKVSLNQNKLALSRLKIFISRKEICMSYVYWMCKACQKINTSPESGTMIFHLRPLPVPLYTAMSLRLVHLLETIAQRTIGWQGSSVCGDIEANIKIVVICNHYVLSSYSLNLTPCIIIKYE